MAIGYTTTHLARAVGDGGLVVTIDPSDEMIAAAQGYLQRAGLRERVRIERGKALDVIPHLRETFDLSSSTRSKRSIRTTSDSHCRACAARGVVIVDNLLWGGQVAGEIRAPDQRAQQMLCESLIVTSLIIRSCGPRFSQLETD